MADTLYLEIVTPEKVLYRGEVKSITGPGAYGELQILPEHAPLFTILEIGKMFFVLEDGDSEWAAVHSGYLEVLDNRITVLADRAELAKDIDLDRVLAAKDRAEGRLKEWADKSREDKDVIRAQLALTKALVRKDVVEEHKNI